MAKINLAISARACSRCLASVSQSCGNALRQNIEKLNNLITSQRITAKGPATILQLPEHHSIEDILVNHDQYFKCVIDLAEELVQQGIREFLVLQR